MILPERRLAYAIAATSPLWLLSGTGAGVWPAAGALTVVVIVALVDLIRIPSGDAMVVERLVAASTGLGEELPIAYEISSRWNLPVKLTLVEYFPAGFSSPEWRETTAALPARGDTSLQLRVVPSRRGFYELGALALRISSPFGLWVRALRRPMRQEVTVAPSLQAAGR